MAAAAAGFVLPAPPSSRAAAVRSHRAHRRAAVHRRRHRAAPPARCCAHRDSDGVAATGTAEARPASSVASSPSAAADGDAVYTAREDDPTLMDSVTQRHRVMRDQPVAIVVLGASGDLAKKKTFPALFSLFYHDLLPKHFAIYGYARRRMADDDFRELILSRLTCRVIDGPHCANKMEEFLPRCSYIAGQYDEAASFEALSETISRDLDARLPSAAHRLFYLAVPPAVFLPAATQIDAVARAPAPAWTRVVLEKPFGRDSASYAALRDALAAVLSEEDTYRIDHYLGKELVQNLMALRFANAIFEPLWNRNYVQRVTISFEEPFGVEGRAGYFDGIGIVRDIMQNHLTQVLSLVGMEAPISLHAEDIRNEKVKLLRSLRPLRAGDFVLGQYGASADGGKRAYLDDDGVDAASRTPTFAACRLHVNNRRWAGVPFVMKAGKALGRRRAEIRVLFREVPGCIFSSPALRNNELVLRVQQEEAVYLRITSKVPGLTSRMEEARLNLFYREAWEESRDIPDAYERLILDVLYGDKSLFIRDDELEAAWAVFSDAIHDMDAPAAPRPLPYEYGSDGPDCSALLDA